VLAVLVALGVVTGPVGSGHAQRDDDRGNSRSGQDEPGDRREGSPLQEAEAEE
jgi:hypothetical protein